jgi:hypothetical protein
MRRGQKEQLRLPIPVVQYGLSSRAMRAQHAAYRFFLGGKKYGICLASMAPIVAGGIGP